MATGSHGELLSGYSSMGILGKMPPFVDDQQAEDLMGRKWKKIMRPLASISRYPCNKLIGLKFTPGKKKDEDCRMKVLRKPDAMNISFKDIKLEVNNTSSNQEAGEISSDKDCQESCRSLVKESATWLRTKGSTDDNYLEWLESLDKLLHSLPEPLQDITVSQQLEEFLASSQKYEEPSLSHIPSICQEVHTTPTSPAAIPMEEQTTQTSTVDPLSFIEGLNMADRDKILADIMDSLLSAQVPTTFSQTPAPITFSQTPTSYQPSQLAGSSEINSPWDTPSSLGPNSPSSSIPSNGDSNPDYPEVVTKLGGEEIPLRSRSMALEPWDTPPSCETFYNPFSACSVNDNPSSCGSTITSADDAAYLEGQTEDINKHTEDSTHIWSPPPQVPPNTDSYLLDLFSSGPCFDYNSSMAVPQFWETPQEPMEVVTDRDHQTPAPVEKEIVEVVVVPPVVGRVKKRIRKELRNPEDIPIWTNSHNSCWLDAALCLLVFNSTLGQWAREPDLLHRLYRDFQRAREATYLPDSRAILNKARTPIRELLHRKLKTAPGQQESLLIGLQQLLLVDKIDRCFQLEYRWVSYCSYCYNTRTDKGSRTCVIPTFVKTPLNFSLPYRAVALTSCTCRSSEPLERSFKIISLPQTFCLHFLTGLLHKDSTAALMDDLAFVYQDMKYRVTGFIQYTQHPNHFTTYIRQDSGWLHCDNLDEDGLARGKTPTDLSAVHPSQVHIVMWEGQELKPKPDSKLNTAYWKRAANSNLDYIRLLLDTSYRSTKYPPYHSKFKTES